MAKLRRSSSDVYGVPEALICCSKALISFCSVLIRPPLVVGIRISSCLASISCIRFKGTFGLWGGGGIGAIAANADGCC
jgi:hypothetical protein